jgi:hypothetical protein
MAYLECIKILALEKIFSISNWEVAMHEIHLTKISIVGNLCFFVHHHVKVHLQLSSSIEHQLINKCATLYPTRCFNYLKLSLWWKTNLHLKYLKLNASYSSNSWGKKKKSIWIYQATMSNHNKFFTKCTKCKMMKCRASPRTQCS